MEEITYNLKMLHQVIEPQSWEIYEGSKPKSRSRPGSVCKKFMGHYIFRFTLSLNKTRHESVLRKLDKLK